MEKTQTLPFDKGDTPGLYNPWSWAGYLTSEPTLPQASFLKDKYDIYRDGASTVYSGLTDFEGHQNFESSERPRPYYNSCKNVKLRGFNYPYGTTTRAYVGSMVYLTPYTRIALPSTSYRDYVTQSESDLIAHEAHDGASRRAWWSMQPRFEGRVQLLNSIFELKDFRDIAKHAIRFPYRNIADGMKTLKRLVNKASREVGAQPDLVKIGELPQILKNLDITTRGLASLYLTKKLAFDPTIADAMNIHRQMGRQVQAEQEAFEKRGTLPNRSHFREVLYKDYSEIVGTRNGYWRKLCKQRKVTFNASMEYVYDYTKRPAMRAAMRYWGLDLNAHVIWNALPFTWVADYFIAIGDSIRNMSPDPNVDLLPLQYCESILSEAKAGYYTTGDSRMFWICVNGLLAPGTQADVAISGYEFSSYKRSVVEPNRGPALPKVRWPTSGQQHILGALLRCFI